MFNKKKKKITELEAEKKELESQVQELKWKNKTLQWQVDNPAKYRVGEKVAGLTIIDVIASRDFDKWSKWVDEMPKPPSFISVITHISLMPNPPRIWRYKLMDPESGKTGVFKEKELIAIPPHEKIKL